MNDDEKPIGDQIKKVVDDLDLETKAKQVATAAEEAVYRGLGAAGQYVHERREGIESFIDRAVSGIDEKTGGRYADQVGQLRDQLTAGVASLADRRPMAVPDDASELELPGADPTAVPETVIEGADDTWAAATDDPSHPDEADPREDLDQP